MTSLFSISVNWTRLGDGGDTTPGYRLTICQVSGLLDILGCLTVLPCSYFVIWWKSTCILYFAGITKALFFFVLSTLAPLMPSARRGFPPCAQFMLFLIKLRHNLSFRDLAYRLDISPRTASRSFRTWLEGMTQLSNEMIVFPRPEVAQSWLTPKERKHFSKLRAVIDSTGVSVSRRVNFAKFMLDQSQNWIILKVKLLRCSIQNVCWECAFSSFSWPVWQVCWGSAFGSVSERGWQAWRSFAKGGLCFQGPRLLRAGWPRKSPRILQSCGLWLTARKCLSQGKLIMRSYR